MTAINPATAALASKVASVLSKTGHWGDEEDVLTRLYAQTLNCPFMSYLVSFDQAVFYLPGALAYVDAELEDSDFVAEALVKFATAWRGFLERHGLYDAIVQRFKNLVLGRAGRFEPGDCNDLVAEFGSCHEEDALDVLLDVMARDKGDGNERLLDAVLDEWLVATDNPACSVSALAMLSRVRKSASALLLYRDRTIRKYAFDQPLIQRHFERARPLIAANCSPDHVLAVERWVAELG